MHDTAPPLLLSQCDFPCALHCTAAPRRTVRPCRTAPCRIQRERTLTQSISQSINAIHMQVTSVVSVHWIAFCSRLRRDTSINKRSRNTHEIFGRPCYRSRLVEPLTHCVVCLSSVCDCDVLYCGKTVRPSQKLSVRVKKLIFLGRRHISTSGFTGTAP